MILAVDQGTSSTKATLFDRTGAAVTSASVPLGQAHPRPGWVQQDAGEILDGVRQVIAEIAASHEIEAVALSTQRESALVWDRATGEPVGPMLGWQDRRTTHRVAELADHAARIRRISGLPVDPMFSALKLQWLLDDVDPDRARSRRGELCVGTVDSWLVTRLTGEHRIEAGNASRTQLLDLATGDWSDELCELFEIPREVLPRVAASDEPTGEVDGLPGRVIRAVLGDSHAGLYGHGVREPGRCARATAPGPRSWAWSTTPRTSLRGWSAPSRGGWATTPRSRWRATSWPAARPSRGCPGCSAAPSPSCTEAARAVPEDHGVTLVPAVAGLGAPHWDPHARAVLVGFDLGTTPAILARAGMEAIANQVADVVDAAAVAAPVEAILADGAPAADDFLMQLQADLSGREVRRPTHAGLSARGAAQLAADTLGIAFDAVDFDVFTPAGDNRAARARWSQALTLTRKEN